jgi:hypothetical protein
MTQHKYQLSFPICYLQKKSRREVLPAAFWINKIKTESTGCRQSTGVVIIVIIAVCSAGKVVHLLIPGKILFYRKEDYHITFTSCKEYFLYAHPFAFLLSVHLRQLILDIIKRLIKFDNYFYSKKGRYG